MEYCEISDFVNAGLRLNILWRRLPRDYFLANI